MKRKDFFCHKHQEKKSLISTIRKINFVFYPALIKCNYFFIQGVKLENGTMAISYVQAQSQNLTLLNKKLIDNSKSWNGMYGWN